LDKSVRRSFFRKPEGMKKKVQDVFLYVIVPIEKVPFGSIVVKRALVAPFSSVRISVRVFPLRV